MSLNISGQARYFRLNLEAPLVTLGNLSPANRERGVAVTRETIIHFSAPLSSETILDQDMFYAEFGGSKILSRAELSSDGMKATLFYLEPLPGSAQVVVTFDGDTVKDHAGAFVDADGDGDPGGQAVIAFNTLSLSPLPGTGVTGQVFASELAPATEGGEPVDTPLAGVTITIDGLEETHRTVTDETGSFTLSPVPPGRFFVHIDGRTVVDEAAGIRYPDQAYYPFVGKAWEAVAGVMDTPVGGTGTVYLPLITVGTLQATSMTEDTMIELPPDVVADNPALAGVSIMVPANSLLSDDGTRGGMIGIAPVAPDRLPGPLPQGLDLPLVITVQTDGPSNFDQPAPVCFPNLPDPTTGELSPPGTKGTLMSFNHDKGIWEAAGGMTVSADGTLACTDPGVGILQPGWHGWIGEAWREFFPPPPPEPPVCYWADISDCLSFARGSHDVCNFYAYQAYNEATKICDAREKTLHPENTGTDNRSDQWVECKLKYGNIVDAKDEACVEQFEMDLEYCEVCHVESTTPQTNPAKASAVIQAALNEPTIEEELANIFEQIKDLLRPVLSNQSPLTPELVAQENALHQLADTMAGGNAGEYLRNLIIKKEEALLLEANKTGIELDDLKLGNAPAYPVLYAANIARPSGDVVLRGETQPYGQYTLFVPADGELLDVVFYDPITKGIAIISPYLSPNLPYNLPRFNLFPLPADAVDSDEDGLSDLVEEVYGTDSRNADSDDDGIPDGAEVEQGTNPLDGLPVQTGVIGTLKTAGKAIDIATGNNLAVLTEGASGVSIVDITDFSQPTILAQLDTPGTSQRVAFSGNLVAVADGDEGLTVINISNSANARITQRVNLPGTQAIAVGAGIGYVGLSSGQIVVVHLSSGSILDQLSVSDPVQDLALEGDYLYALTGDRLHVISVLGDVFAVVGSASSPFDASQNTRLFVGGGVAYTLHRTGYNTLDVSNPAEPVLITQGNTTQFGWRQIVANGSGLGLAAVGPNSTNDGAHDISLYDLTDPAQTEVFVTTFPTQGKAHAVSIFNGLAYVADDSEGMQIINYLPYDANGVPPSITLSSSFGEGEAESGQRARVTALVGDDVQVRNVEFYLDGVKAFTDSAFPFEFRFVAPILSEEKDSFLLSARAVDTGGNFTWSDEQVVPLGPDITAPRVTATTPTGGARTLLRIQAFFNEPMDPETLTSTSLTLSSAGPDGLLDTPDDGEHGTQYREILYRPDQSSVSLNFAPLPDDLYQAVITTAATDLAGNNLAEDVFWTFRVADAAFWISTNNGEWNDPINWSEGAIPVPNDDVILPSFDNVAITLPSGVTQLRNLTIYGALAISAGSSLEVTENLILNGSLEISGATLALSGIAELNQNLTLNGGTILGGTVTQTDEGRLLFSNFQSVLDGVSVNGDLDLTTGSARVLISNGLTLNGTVRIDNNGGIGFTGVQTFDNASVVFEGSSGSLSAEGNATLTLGPAMVISGKTADIGRPVFQGLSSHLINQGLISADMDGGTLRINPTQFTNTGTVEVKNGGNISLSLIGNTWSNSGLVKATGGMLTLAGTFTNTGTIQADTATVNLNGTFTLPSLGTFQRTGGTVQVSGDLDLTGDTLTLDATTGTWTLIGGTIMGGTVTQTDEGRLLFSTTAGTLDGVSVNGDLDLTTGGSRLLIRNGLSLNGIVRIDNNGGIAFTGVQTFDNASVVFEGNSGSLSAEGNAILTLGPGMVVRGKTGTISRPIFQGLGSHIINEGLISADTDGGTLTINPTQFTNAGSIAIKAGSVVSVSEPFTQSNSGTLAFELGGTLASEFGRLISSSAFTLDGTLDVSVSGGFTPTSGNEFEIMTFGSVSGDFTTKNGLDQGGLTLELDYGATNLRLVAP